MSVLSRFSNQNDPNAFTGEGLLSGALIPYAATINLPLPVKKALKSFVDIDVLTGALLLTQTNVTRYDEGDEVVIRFISDANARVVTFSAGFRAAGTFTVGAAGVAHVGIAKCIFMDGKLQVLATSSAAV